MAVHLAVRQPATDPSPAPGPESDPLTTDDLLIEEVSIDGLCGVY